MKWEWEWCAPSTRSVWEAPQLRRPWFSELFWTLVPLEITYKYRKRTVTIIGLSVLKYLLLLRLLLLNMLRWLDLPPSEDPEDFNRTRLLSNPQPVPPRTQQSRCLWIPQLLHSISCLQWRDCEQIRPRRLSRIDWSVVSKLICDQSEFVGKRCNLKILLYRLIRLWQLWRGRLRLCVVLCSTREKFMRYIGTKGVTPCRPLAHHILVGLG